jgi:hypothetical protein
MKIKLALFFLIFPFLLFGEQDVSFRVLPEAVLPLEPVSQKLFTAGYRIGTELDWAFLPFFGIALRGNYSAVFTGVDDSAVLFEGSLGPFFRWQPFERFAFDAGLYGGVYRCNWRDSTVLDIAAGASLSASYHLSSYIALTAGAGYTVYFDRPSILMNSVNISLGVSFNLTELLRRRSRITVENQSWNMVFPVSYAWYEHNPVGTVKITNGEKNRITSVEASFFLEQYMSQPTLFGTIPSLAAGESVELPVTALFSESVLGLTEKANANARIIVNYRILGSQKEADLQVPLQIYDRNAMTWDDDRRAASFVSPGDPAVKLFSHHVAAVVETRMRPGISRNIQYAMGIFEALNAGGIHYIIDPLSSYIVLSEEAGIPDSLNYPYQTLFYRGGDCDDLSILFCSLMESLGVPSAFITVPGHIYAAIDSGIKSGAAPGAGGEEDFFAPGDLIEYGGTWWLPLEITIPQEGFYAAWRTGIREWREGEGGRDLYPIRECWTTYSPANVPEATSENIPLAGEAELVRAFERAVAEWGENPKAMEAAAGRLPREGRASAEIHNALGIYYGSLGLFKKAASEFALAGAAGGVNLGHIAFIEGRHAEALRLYNEGLRQESSKPLSLLGIARVSYEAKDFPSVDAAYRQLFSINPALAKQYPYLGSFREGANRPASWADRLVSTIWQRPGWEEDLFPGENTPAGPSSPGNGGLTEMLSPE